MMILMGPSQHWIPHDSPALWPVPGARGAFWGFWGFRGAERMPPGLASHFLHQNPPTAATGLRAGPGRGHGRGQERQRRALRQECPETLEPRPGEGMEVPPTPKSQL